MIGDMLISNYMCSDKCNDCEFETHIALNNPICVSCQNMTVLNKRDNYKKRDFSLHRKTSQLS